MLLCTLGGLRLEGHDFRRPKPLLLLSYLALEGPQTRRHLAELFWLGAASPLGSLSMALTRLRQGAPGSFAEGEPRLRACVATDAQTMLAALERGEAEQALALYPGPFLDGVHLRNWGAELEEWVYATREFLAERLRGALLTLAEAEAARGRFEAAAARADAVYLLPGTAEPEVETLARLHTLMLAGNSPRAAALRREAEAFALALAPSREAARERLRAASPPARNPAPPQHSLLSHSLPPHSLPLRATSFIGRDLELAELADRLAEPDCPILTLVGPAGVGKTRLALQLAQEQLKLGTFAGGVRFVSLDALSSPAFIPANLAAALGLELRAGGEPLAQLVRHLGASSVLLVLDNLEHLLAGTPALAELVRACPALKLLVTSRERLNLEEEQVFPVEGLPFPEAELPAELAERADAVRLFVQRARRSRPDFALDEATLPAVIEICRLVGGLPLGLELAATWVRVMPCADIAGEIARNLDFLSTPTRNVPERHRSLRVAFEHSWALLTPRERQVLRKLAVFRGGFRQEAASEVADATIPVLASLVDKSLLRVTPGGRYDRHPLLYSYTREKLAAHPGELAQTENKHGAYYLRLFQQQSEGIHGNKQREIFATIAEEWENIRAALKRSGTGAGEDELLRWVELMELWCEYRGYYEEGLEFLTSLASRLPESNPQHHALLGRVLLAAAWYRQRCGHYHQASQLVERGLRLLRPLGKDVWIARGLNTLGAIAERKGDFVQAKQYYQEALALARNYPDDILSANILANLAIVAYDLGDYRRSRQDYLEALALYRKQGNHIGFVRNLNNFGNLCLVSGKLGEAEAALQEGLRLARDSGFLDIIPSFLANLGELAYEHGDFARTRTLNEEALAMVQKSGKQYLQATILSNLGRASIALADYGQAHSYCRRALQVAWSIDNIPNVMQALLTLAELWAKQSGGEQAAGLLALVIYHPATMQAERDCAKKLLDKLQGQLVPAVLERALEHGKALKVEDVVAQMSASP